MVSRNTSRQTSGPELSERSLDEPPRSPSLAALAGTVYVAAVLVNYLWEVPQMLFYEWWDASWSVGLLVCFLSALGDGLLVLALYGIGCFLFKRRDWILEPGLSGYTFLVFSGIVVAIVVELQALAWNRWSYNALMPRIPGLGVGLLPVAQMMVLPPLVARLAQWWLTRYKVFKLRGQTHL